MSTREPRSRSKRASTSPGTARRATWPMCRGPLAYGHAGAMRTVRSGFRVATDHEGNLPAHLLAQCRRDLRRSAAQHLLVHLGQLARQRDRPVRQNLGDQVERLTNAKWRLKRDRRAWVGFEALHQPAHLPRPARQVAEECETRTADSGN